MALEVQPRKLWSSRVIVSSDSGHWARAPAPERRHNLRPIGQQFIFHFIIICNTN